MSPSDRAELERKTLIEDNGAALVLLSHVLIQARSNDNRLQPELLRLVELFACGKPEDFWSAFDAAFDEGGPLKPLKLGGAS